MSEAPEHLKRVVSNMDKEQASRSDEGFVSLLLLSPTALSYIKEWAVVYDQGDVSHALELDMWRSSPWR